MCKAWNVRDALLLTGATHMSKYWGDTAVDADQISIIRSIMWIRRFDPPFMRHERASHAMDA